MTRAAVIRITVVHQAALGDTVLLLPLFRSLRQRFAPEPCAITLVTHANLGQMLTMLGVVEGYASAEDRAHSRWFAPPTIEEASPAGNSGDISHDPAPAWAQAEILISAVSTGKDAWADHALRARRGMQGNFPGGTALLFFEPRPPVDYAGHVTAWHREQLAAQGMELPEESPGPPRVNPDGAIVIHPGSGGDAKCWPRDRFLSLGRNLKRLGIVPTFILGEAEQERWGRSLIETLKDEFPWYLHMGLYELAEKMGRARLYLGNDSGVTHLAAAMGVPVIALFGPSNDQQWRPVGPSAQVLRAAAPHEKSLEHLEEATVLQEMLAELRKL